MICKALIIAQLMFFSCAYSQTQEKMHDVKISDARVYLYSGNKGFTTAGAYSHFDDMIKTGIKTKQLINIDIKKIQSILNKAEQKKHWQTKVGMNITFCEISFKETGILSKVIIRTGREKTIVTDLTRNIDYNITDSEDISWLLAFTNGFKTE
jgi:hypothetical protein